MKLKQILNEILTEQKDFFSIELEDVTDSQKILSDPKYREIFTFVKSNIEKHIENDSIKIWRAMVVSEEWVQNLLNGEDSGLGIYWSYDRDGAYSYWDERAGEGATINIVLGGKVYLSEIDWEYTFLAKLKADQEDKEMEIGLNKGAEVQILSVESENQQIDIDSIKGMEFRA